MWDLPGGGRENGESPIETAQREVFEELRISIRTEGISYQKEYPAMLDKDSIAYFIACNVTREQVDNIVFGDEGQGWKLMTVDELLNDGNTVPHLRGRLEDLVNSPDAKEFNLISTL